MEFKQFKIQAATLFKKFVEEKRIDKSYVKAFKKEINMAERYYRDGRDLYNEFEEKKEKLDNRYILPYLFGFTNEFKWDEPEVVQISDIAGAPDYDADFAPSGRTLIKEYLENKYGKEKCIPVGTYSTLGCSSAAKDLLRVYGIDFKKSNAFTTELDSSLSWEDNLENLKNNKIEQYKFYEDNKNILDLVPSFLNKIRGASVHAGGIVILDKPVYERTPVDRVNGQVITAYPESGGEQALDEEKIIKLDILTVSILDVIKHTIEKISEELYEIIDDDGIKKIVPASYIDQEILKI